MLFCLTANHRNTEFDVLDRISRVVDGSAADLLAAHDYVRGAVVLSTCNRFEAYLELEEPLTAAMPLAHQAIFDILDERAGADADALRSSAVALSGQEAVTHLFAVSAGLESMVVGEEEISGQVQRALVAAREAGTTSGGLEHAFQRAARATRDMRAQSNLVANGRSLARLALDMVSSRVVDWSAIPVLIVGTGSYAATTIAALRARGAGDVRVFSATGRAVNFAARYGIRAESDLPTAIASAAIVITCTARYTVVPEHIPDSRPRLIVDLGLPRNVAPEVAALPGVELLDLEIIGKHAALPELGAGSAHVHVANAAAEFAADRAAAPAIVAFRTRIDELLEAEVARARQRGAGDETEAALRHLAGVLSHGPSVRARELAAEGRLGEFEAALETLFGVQVPERSAELPVAAHHRLRLLG